MAVRVSVKKEKTHTHLGVRIVGVRGWRACVWRVGMRMWIRIKKERKKILTWVWMMDACVRADVLRADAD